MRIRIDEIPDSGRFIHFHWDGERLKQFMPPDDPFEIELVKPVNVDMEIYKRPDHIRIVGAIRSVLSLACHRCLSEFERPLEEELDVFLVDAGKAPEEEELELETEELEYEFFDGEVIEIDRLVAEQIFLALPYKVLCSENCRGLCPRCGVNLNEEQCSCDQNLAAKPFAALREIKTHPAR
mgnify:CR=1 FL=1